MDLNREDSSPSEETAPVTPDFDSVINHAEIRDRDKVVSGPGYDPVAQTAEYMKRAVRLEEEWDTVLRRAREELLKINAVELYEGFFRDLAARINAGQGNINKLASLLEDVAIRGFGMSPDQVIIRRPDKGGTRYKAEVRGTKKFLTDAIIGPHFLNLIESTQLDSNTRVGSSDVSQHVSAVPIPARYFRRSVPFVLNNAAGALLSTSGGGIAYENLFNADSGRCEWSVPINSE